MSPLKVGNKEWLIPDNGSSPDEWKIYFGKLSKEFGKTNARMIWLITWKEVGSMSLATNPSFNKWLQDNELDVTNALTRSVSDISEIGSNYLGLGKNISKLLKIAVPATLGLTLAIVIYFLYKTAKTASIEDIAMLTPAGRTMKMTKSIQ